ncbi:hypothetical protein F5Y19DRAFT_413868 [Xylariaceae sp. FL1651]|nr:hypothetical protein F5Y19DRAFT_413868 [Xylariaceae sp. FL1651]
MYTGSCAIIQAETNWYCMPFLAFSPWSTVVGALSQVFRQLSQNASRRRRTIIMELSWNFVPCGFFCIVTEQIFGSLETMPGLDTRS